MQNGPIAAVLVLIATALCACQHVPPQPLDIAAVRADITDRVNRLDDVRAYADSLSTQADTEYAAFDVDDGLTLHEATLIALWYNGDARFAREEVEHAQIRARLAGLLPDPELTTTIGEKQVDVGSRIEDSLILGAGLKITIPVSGRRGATRTLRASEFKLALLEAEEVEWSVVQELRLAWQEWLAAYESVSLLKSHVDELSAIAALTRELASVGELSAVEARFLEIEHSRLTAELQHESGTLLSKRLECLQIMGLHPSANVELNPEPWSIHEGPLTNEVPDTHPTVAKLQTEYQVAEDALRLELKKPYPDITLSPGIMDEEDETSIQLGLGIPLPVWNANRLGIAEAIAHRHDAHIRFENGLHELVSDLARFHIEAESAKKQWDVLANETAAMVESQSRQSNELLSAGELDMTLLNSLLTQSLTVKRELIDARLRHKCAVISILAATEPYQFESIFEWENSR